MNTHQFSSVQFSLSVMSDSLRPHELQHARPPCPSRTTGVYPNPCPLSRWCHPTISSSVVPFSSCSQSFPASGSFEMSQLFASEAKVLEFQLHQSFQWTPRTDFFRMDWLYLLAVQGTLKRSPQLKSRDNTLPTKICLVKAMVFPVVMYGWMWVGTIKKAECWRMDAFELWCWRRLLIVPGLQGETRSLSQSILNEISPGCSLEALMLKLKLQYFGHLMQRTDSFEKTLILGKIEGR